MNESLFWTILLMPPFTALFCYLQKSTKQILTTIFWAGLVWMSIAVMLSINSFSKDSIQILNGLLHLDGLSLYHLLILGLIFGASSIYSHSYITEEKKRDRLAIKEIRRFGLLWFSAAFAMSIVITSNNLGIMWVGIEATTLITAFLISTHRTPLSLEAMWKYLVVCSVGVAFAFVGTLLVASSAQKIGFSSSELLLWTHLYRSSSLLNPATMKLAFIFLLVGYGTKVGLAPLHSWLPDAHSQAPAPVSALFSGFMLNTALYCIMRYIPLVEGATGKSGYALNLLAVFGLISILFSAFFIIFQHDGKRLLAYHSVEHMGIISLGLGLGGLGTFAALWHTLNHSICKTLAFFAIGRIGQMHGTHDLNRIAGIMRRSPLWGVAFFGSILVLIGSAPFAIFMSEFQIVRATIESNSIISLILFLIGTGIVFVAALKHAIIPAWGRQIKEPQKISTGKSEIFIVVIGLLLLLVLGIWLPEPLRLIIARAVNILGGKI